jgi:hypothetical protein
MQNEARHKTGQLYAKAAYLNIQQFSVLQRMVQVLCALFSLVLTSSHAANWHDCHTDCHGNYCQMSK